MDLRLTTVLITLATVAVTACSEPSKDDSNSADTAAATDSQTP